MKLKKINFIKVKAPGKLILSGEWSVLEKNNPCVVLPINKFVTSRISKSKKSIIISAHDINLKNFKFHFIKNKIKAEKKLSQIQHKKFLLLKTAIETALNFLKSKKIKLKNFKLTINSQISKIKLHNNSYTKIGLGSSAATVVACIESIIKFHKFFTKKKEINKIRKILFKLSVIAHYKAQNCCGSGTDIAASCYKKPIVYKKFDSIWLNKKIKINQNLSKIIKLKWPKLKIHSIKIPSDLILLTAFCGYASSTTELIKKIDKIKNSSSYKNKILKINNTTKKIILAIKNYSKLDKNRILKLIKKNRLLLKNLNKNLETKELTELINIANKNLAAAKFSGAGGGDCVIAICFDKKIAKKIILDWRNAGFYCLNIKILY